MSSSFPSTYSASIITAKVSLARFPRRLWQKTLEHRHAPRSLPGPQGRAQHLPRQQRLPAAASLLLGARLAPGRRLGRRGGAVHLAELLPLLQLLPEGEEGGGRRPGARPDVLAGEGARGALPGASCAVGGRKVLRVVEAGRAGGQGAAGGSRARGLAVERRQRFLQEEGKGRR